MTFNSDYMEPNARERQRREAAGNLVYLLIKLGEPVPKKLRDAATHIYGEGVELDEVVGDLYNKLKSLTPEQEDAIVYNGRSANARVLADWWDKRLAEDEQRRAEEVKLEQDFARELERGAKLYIGGVLFDLIDLDDPMSFDFESCLKSRFEKVSQIRTKYLNKGMPEQRIIELGNPIMEKLKRIGEAMA